MSLATDRHVATFAAHGGLALATGAVVAAAARSAPPQVFAAVAIWLAATGVAVGVVLVPLERLLVTHPWVRRADRYTAGLVAVAAAGTVGLTASTVIAISAMAWTASQLAVTPRRAAAIRDGRWRQYRHSIAIDAATRAFVAVWVVALPDAVTPVALLLAATAPAPLLTLGPSRSVHHPQAPPGTGSPRPLIRLVAASAASTWLLQAPVLIQYLRNPDALVGTTAVATAARAALWLTPALTAIAAHRAVRESRPVPVGALTALPVLTVITFIASTAVAGSVPPLGSAILATTASLAAVAAFAHQQCLIATGRTPVVLRIWVGSALAGTTLWFMLPAQPATIFAVQAAALGTAAVAIRFTARNDPDNTHDPSTTTAPRTGPRDRTRPSRKHPALRWVWTMQLV